MIGREDAEALIRKTLQDERRVRHSLAVAARMETLARGSGDDAETWYLTGLLHDIDLPRTMDDPAMHGILARDMLAGLLPPESIGAIMSHDHRTGIPAATEMARALIFADVLDNLRANVGMAEIGECARNNAWDALRGRFPGKEYHIGVVEAYWKRRPGIRI